MTSINTMVTSRHTVNVYGCGGGGINVTSELEAHRNSPDVGFARLLPYYIDTSRSNLSNKQLPHESVYLFEDIDGSGKVRSTNYDVIAKNVLGILQRFKPAEFNIVIHTASGGSGSVLGPVLVSELKARGAQVLVIMVGSTDTRVEIENTIKSLKSYEGIASLRNSPVVMNYVENSRELSRFDVNRRIKGNISYLLGLFSGNNEELDTADLKSWLNFTSFTNMPAQLSSLNFATNPKELQSAGTATSVATLAMPDMNTRLDITPAYQCVGYAPSNWRFGAPDSAQMIEKDPIHYVISTDFVARAMASLTNALKEVDSAFASQIARPSILSQSDKTTESGLVL